ncbi:hypothetical protein PVK06_040400 [Gossypium arboreum]|uniref:Uncharacterized protein n=1 Tax=Gossypium arboreum TaxID=29729 RepID=A0ABR0N5D9_GOSAR|nr:hypothetical protein PVK06_040400 [Gossypium arboreum]
MQSTRIEKKKRKETDKEEKKEEAGKIVVKHEWHSLQDSNRKYQERIRREAKG